MTTCAVAGLLVSLLVVLVAAPGVTAAPLVEADGQPRFMLKDGEILDRRTGLQWQRCSLGQRWQPALGCVGIAKKLWYSEALALENEHWRMPRVGELQSLFDAREGDVADRAAFPDSPVSSYWASGIDGTAEVWGGPCNMERDDSCTRTNALAVRLVRRRLPLPAGAK